MPLFGHRQFVLGAVGLAVAGACADDGGSTAPPGNVSTSTTAASTGPTVSTTTIAAETPVLPAPGSIGLIDEAAWQARVQRYLDHAVASPRPASASGVAVQLAQARRDPTFTWDTASVTVDGFADRFTQIDEWRDTRDFQLMYFHWLLAYGRGETSSTQLDESLLEAIRQRMLDNRYRYDDPLPEGRIDHLWYWSENHRLINATNEFLAGAAFSDETFTVTGLTGAEHAARARLKILEWVMERARFGFFEWHSNVYMAKNITPLLTLVELSDDEEIVAAAARGLDLCLVDMAAHYHRGAYVAPHGRTYKKDKMTARDEDTYDVAKLLFDRTPTDHQSVDSTTATYFCLAERYRPPQAVIDMAKNERIAVVRERHGVHIDSTEPVSDSPTAPFGYDFKDPANLEFWWSAGAIGVWQMAEVSVAEADAHQLWDGDVFGQIKLLADVMGRDVDRLEEWLVKNYMILNIGGLDDANTYTWRSPWVSLATVVDHRKGEMRDQVHVWQATIDPDARVFTTHPMTGLPESTDWNEDDGPGYWTGDASMPRSAQHERTAVHIYSPLYDETTDPLLAQVFTYRNYTHAYFPQDHFDEVRQIGNWTIGAKDGGYIALWSHRATAWRTYDPAVHATDGMTLPFDLVAEGGADNVWIVEVGTEDDGSFDEFVSAVTAVEPEVTGEWADTSVQWTSPTGGPITFGWEAAFTVDGTEQPLADFPRHESPWGTVDRLSTSHRWETPNGVLELDFEAGTRSVAN
jgi:hypothetical protein